MTSILTARPDREEMAQVYSASGVKVDVRAMPATQRPTTTLLTYGNTKRLVADLWQIPDPKKLPQVSNEVEGVATSQQREENGVIRPQAG